MENSIFTTSIQTALYTSTNTYSPKGERGIFFPFSNGETIGERAAGDFLYVKENHLGNVLSVVSDRKLGVDNNSDNIVDYYLADVVSTTDYYAFGAQMPGRTFVGTTYRYGFNGQEKIDEVYGTGNYLDFTYRGYNPRLGRFFAIDPMFKEFPFYSPYQFASNNPILAIELEGLESSDNKNESEKKTSENTTPTEEKKVLDTKTVGKNWDNSVYMGTNGNPKNTDGTDSYEPKPQESMDARAKRHDQGSGGIASRTTENMKEDAVFVVGAISDLAKAAENTFIIPFMGMGNAKANPNKDPITNKPISGTTTKRAAAGATAITVVTAGKVILSVTVDPVVKVYDETVESVKKVYYQTVKGLNNFQNWGH